MRPHHKLDAWKQAINLVVAHFLSNAQGSASELETELLISNRLGYLNERTYVNLTSPLDRIARLITGLSKHVTAE